MNIVDIIIIIFIIMGALLGFKRGLTRELVSCVGLILVVIFSFLLKNPLSVFFYENLPFFKFGGVLKGVTVLNIVLYEIMAFFVVFVILMIVLKVLMFATSIFEKILTITIILGIPSKIMGAIVGALEWFIVSFIVIYICSLPVFNIDVISQSKFKTEVMPKTPILANVTSNSLKVVDEFVELKDKYKNTDNANQFNLETLDLFLKYKVVSVESVDKLVEKDKISISGIETVLEKYREENNGNN